MVLRWKMKWKNCHTWCYQETPLGELGYFRILEIRKWQGTGCCEHRAQHGRGPEEGQGGLFQELRGPVAGGGESGRGERQVVLSRDEGCAHTKRSCVQTLQAWRGWMGILFSVQ